MGLRGRQAKITYIDAERLESLDAPAFLPEGDCQNFWYAHVKYLSDNGILTKATEPSFIHCCELWGMTRFLFNDRNAKSQKLYLDTVKSFNTLAKLFRLLPTEKPGLPQDRSQQFKVFEPNIPLNHDYELEKEFGKV